MQLRLFMNTAPGTAQILCFAFKSPHRCLIFSQILAGLNDCLLLPAISQVLEQSISLAHLNAHDIKSLPFPTT